MRPEHMAAVAGFIDRALRSENDETKLESLRSEVEEFCLSFPYHVSVTEEMDA
jgi:glycine/serine hydroxymethyltransferase